ncbi:hypothetical protein IM660_16470 [Ruania alkalisoli]|uniref:Uncharacterized protein n=1 Tax=Ruania alkalisoli TaxID=2779775 RepID=A0A7M1SRI3_9MICO|nr:hypothetical protein [Ruania alkalisoli]QOR70188.1 hypothetical protein IM660_16470 [Ruania alkalisoli]
MSVQAMGPTYAGGTEPIVSGGYDVLYLPDVNNRELIRQGESPVFYYIPNLVRMARKDGPDSGDYLFNLVRFAGTGGEAVIGSPGEVAGGVLTFSVTGAIPEHVRRQSESQITAKYAESEDVFWGLKGRRKEPTFRPAIITENITSVSNVSPTSRGLPTLPSAGGSRFAYRGTAGRPRLTRTRDESGPPPVAEDGSPVLTGGSGSNLDPWYWQMHGNGKGSIVPTGTHAFSGLIGAYPAAICWEAFHGTASPLIVIQNYKLKVWSPVVTLDIVGNWDRVFEHFSAAASGRAFWASADIQTEFNNMRTNGTITVDLKVDTTLPGSEEIARRLDEKSNLVYEKFMEQAKGMIFDPPPPEVEAAEADSGSFTPWGVGVALKYRRDTTRLNLEYHETQQFAYLQDHTISSSMAGMFDEIKDDPEAERKYFLTVYLDDWPRKLARVVRPVAAWEDGNVEFLSVQVGYPNTSGEIQWEGHSFAGLEGEDGSWKYQTAQKVAADVANAPEDWSPDKTFVKRKVHLAEPPSEASDPYRRVQIDNNVIDLDPEPNGQLLNDTTLEVRADTAGRLAVGPVELGVVLTDNTQKVEAEFEPVDPDTREPLGRPSVRFSWGEDDLDTDRFWTVFTSDPEFRPFYRYRVHVTVKGTLFEPGRSWSGDWEYSSGNGPLVVNVPQPDPERGVRYVPEERIARLRGMIPDGAGSAGPESAGPESSAGAGGSDGAAGARTGVRTGPPARYLDYSL